MTTAYPYVTYDSSSLLWTDPTKEATDELVADINQLYATAYKFGITDDLLEQALDIMTGQSHGSATTTDTTSSLFSAMNALLVDLQCMAVLIGMVAEVMGILSDVQNLFTTDQAAFLNIENAFTEDPSGGKFMGGSTYNPYFDEYFTNSEGVQETQFEEDSATFNQCLQIMTTMTFTVHKADGTTVQATGVLDLLSNPDYWGNLADKDQIFYGKAPLNSTSETMLEDSIDEIEGAFGGTWNPIDLSWVYNTEMKDFQKWAQPVQDSSTKVDDTTSMYTVYDEPTDITNAQDQAKDQLQENTTSLQNTLQYMTTILQQDEGAVQEMSDTLTDWESYINSKTG